MFARLTADRLRPERHRPTGASRGDGTRERPEALTADATGGFTDGLASRTASRGPRVACGPLVWFLASGSAHLGAEAETVGARVRNARARCGSTPLTHPLPVLAREGYPLILGAATAALLLIATALLFGGWTWGLGLVGLVALGFTIWFFRDPLRTPPPDVEGLLLAPADGKVVEIVEEEEPLYIQGPARRLSIFLSPLNVHVNRSPISGTVEFERYVPGEYLVAWHPKASEKNERSEIGARHANGTPVLFKQIAGAVARRIVYHVTVGDDVRAGDRFGIVKFGSRMDVIVPPHIHFDVEVGQRTVAGETVIGRLTSPASGPSAGGIDPTSAADS